MHTKLIVLTDKDGNKTSQDARQAVNTALMAQGFAGEGGMFSSPPADWFVIGGRWSGELTMARLDQEKLKAFWQEFERLELGWTGKDKPEKDQKNKTAELFKQFFPDFQEQLPVWRDAYAPLGFEDDAQVLDKTLFDYVRKLTQYPDSGDLCDGNCFVDLDDTDSELTEDAIGKKWVVVVDFHF
jgi:hypothetical protein